MCRRSKILKKLIYRKRTESYILSCMAPIASPPDFLPVSVKSNHFRARVALMSRRFVCKHNINLLLQTNLLLVSLCLVLGIPAKIEAQPANTTDHSDPVDEPVGSDYLDRHLAAKNIVPLKRSVELDIRRLGILVKYLGKDVATSEKEYADVAAIYRKAIESYYGGDALEAYRHLMASHVRAFELYKKFSEVYRTKTVQMATEITQQIAGIETDPNAGSSYFEIAEATHRLAIVRNQIKLGDEMIRFRRPDQAIIQYKNARLMTILTSYHLERDPAKRKDILKKYEADLKELGFSRSNLADEIVPDQSVPPAKPSETK